MDLLNIPEDLPKAKASKRVRFRSSILSIRNNLQSRASQLSVVFQQRLEAIKYIKNSPLINYVSCTPESQTLKRYVNYFLYLLEIIIFYGLSFNFYFILQVFILNGNFCSEHTGFHQLHSILEATNVTSQLDEAGHADNLQNGINSTSATSSLFICEGELADSQLKITSFISSLAAALLTLPNNLYTYLVKIKLFKELKVMSGLLQILGLLLLA